MDLFNAHPLRKTFHITKCYGFRVVAGAVEPLECELLGTFKSTGVAERILRRDLLNPTVTVTRVEVVARVYEISAEDFFSSASVVESKE